MSVLYSIELKFEDFNKEKMTELFDSLNQGYAFELLEAKLNDQLVDEGDFDITKERLQGVIKKSDSFILSVTLKESNPQYKEELFEVNLFARLKSDSLGITIDPAFLNQGVNESLKFFFETIYHLFKDTECKIKFLCDTQILNSGKLSADLMSEILEYFERHKEGK